MLIIIELKVERKGTESMDPMIVFNQILQLSLLIFLGFFLHRFSILDDDFCKKLNRLILNVTTPAMIVASVCDPSGISADSMKITFAAAILIYTALPVVTFFLVKLLRVSQKEFGIYWFMSIFSNIGFMGFPVMRAIFGAQSVFYTSIYNMVFTLLVYTLGVWILTRDQEGHEFKLEMKNIFTPGIIASIAAILIYVLHIPVPAIVGESINLVGETTPCLSMLMIGATLAQINLKSIFTSCRLMIYSLAKQFVFPILCAPVLKMFIQDPLIFGISLIVLAMPVGNSAVIFPMAYGVDYELGAKGVFLTTLLSIVSIPLVVSLFL